MARFEQATWRGDLYRRQLRLAAGPPSRLARAPFGQWLGPIPNVTKGGMRRPLLGLVLHIEQGSEAGTSNWFHNPKAHASAHFGNPKNGGLDQWVDTADAAWAQMAGNARWVSVEHEGFSGEALTASQLENDAQLLAWLHATEGIPLAVTDSPNVPGLGWHGMGGAAWGGHYDCPGDPIKAARGAIIRRATEILGGVPAPTPTLEEDDVAHPIYKTSLPGLQFAVIGGKAVPMGSTGQLQRLVAAGLVADDGHGNPAVPKPIPDAEFAAAFGQASRLKRLTTIDPEHAHLFDKKGLRMPIEPPKNPGLPGLGSMPRQNVPPAEIYAESVELGPIGGPRGVSTSEFLVGVAAFAILVVCTAAVLILSPDPATRKFITDSLTKLVALAVGYMASRGIVKFGQGVASGTKGG